MSELALLNPLRRLARSDPFTRDIDDFFKGFFLTPMALNSQAPGQFPVDVTEDDTQYQVRAEIPGFNKEDIQVAVNGDQVSISAEIKKENKTASGVLGNDGGTRGGAKTFHVVAQLGVFGCRKVVKLRQDLDHFEDVTGKFCRLTKMLGILERRVAVV